MKTAQSKAIHDKFVLERRLKNRLSWFYWIPGLSLVNMILVIAGLKFRFIFGLGITEFINLVFLDLAKSLGFPFFVLVILLNILIFSVYGGLAVFGSKKNRTVILSGIIFYSFDILFLVFLADWLGILFHIFVLSFLINGYETINKIKALEKNGQIIITDEYDEKVSFSSPTFDNEFLRAASALVILLIAVITTYFLTGGR